MTQASFLPPLPQNRNLQKFNLESAPSDMKNRDMWMLLRQRHKPFLYGLEEALYAFVWSNSTQGSVRQVFEGLSWTKV